MKSLTSKFTGIFFALICLFSLMGSNAICYAEAEAVAEVTPAEVAAAEEAAPVKIKVLILPKFEIGKMTGDVAGEAQYYYEGYFKDAQEYDVKGCVPGHKLHVTVDGVALYVTSSGKANAAAGTCAILKDSRFDFSDAYVISTGCGGASYGYGVMGDVFVISETADYDLGHRVDVRDLQNKKQKVTWYPDKLFFQYSHFALNPELTDKIYDMVKNIPLDTTPRTSRFMAAAFHNEPWACRQPQVMQGTALTSDNYWKGIHDHDNAVAVCSFYKCRHPFAVAEMEDNAIATVLDSFGLLNRYIIIRDAVNMDVFMNGDRPEYSWGGHQRNITEADNSETADIFDTAMKNNYKVGRVIIDAILEGRL